MVRTAERTRLSSDRAESGLTELYTFKWVASYEEELNLLYWLFC